MQYADFKQKLQGRVFGDDLKYPEYYIGLFRVTNAKTKLIQNLTQSCEIK